MFVKYPLKSKLLYSDREMLKLFSENRRKLFSCWLGGPHCCKESDCQTVRFHFIVLYHIIFLKSFLWLMCLWSFQFINTIRCKKFEPWATVVNSYMGMKSRHPVKAAPKPQQSALSNTNWAEPHGNSIILIVNRTPALQITVSKLRHQHTAN